MESAIWKGRMKQSDLDRPSRYAHWTMLDLWHEMARIRRRLAAMQDEEQKRKEKQDGDTINDNTSKQHASAGSHINSKGDI
jgi:hypothetical protein